MRTTTHAMAWHGSVVFATFLLTSFAAATAHAGVAQKLSPEDQLSSKFRINDDDPESSVPTTKQKNDNPLEFGYFLQDLLIQAEAAHAAKDYPALVRYDRALVKAAPERAKSWSKLCEAYDLIADPAKAILACKQAIQRDGAEVGDFLRLAKLTLQKPEGLAVEEATHMKAMLDHLDTQEPTLQTTAADLRCQLAIKTSDVALLQTCTTVLGKLAPNDSKTVVYQWSLAVRQGQGEDARRLFARAKTMGIPSENLERMAKFTPGLASAGARWAMAAIFLVCAMGGVVYWSYQRRRTPSPA